MVTKMHVRSLLTTKGFADGEILFNGVKIGRFVSYGTNGPRNKTEYASRIYAPHLRIEAKASKVSTLLERVASVLTREIKSGNYEVPISPDAANTPDVPQLDESAIKG